MSIDGRLNRLMQTLSARERVILIARAYRDNTPRDQQWRQTMPPDQTAEFNRLLALLNACSVHLPMFVGMTHDCSEQVYQRFMWLDTIIDSGTQVWRLAQLLPKSKQKQAEKVVAKSYPLATLPWDPEDHHHSWLNVSDRMEKGIRTDVVGLWEQVIAIDVVVGEVATELDGEDPLKPTIRRLQEAARRNLTELHAILSAMEPFGLPAEPGEEALSLARTFFDNGRRLLE